MSGLLISAVGLEAAPALAQADRRLQLEEVVVTAQKREQKVQDVSLAVSAISGDAMQAAGIDDVEDLTRHIPALQVQTNTAPVATNYRIRRVGNLGNIPTFEPAVGVFLDGAFRNRPLFSAGELFDIERVEVLRGPQSTLYGKNATAGVVAVYTRAPAEEMEGRAEFEAGHLEGAADATQYRLLSGVSGPLGDSVGASIGLSYATHDHTFANALATSEKEANDLERLAVRGQLQWTPTDALTLRFIAGTTEEDDDTLLADVYIEPGSTAAIAGAVLRKAGLSEACASNDSRDREMCSREPATTDLSTREATMLADYTLDNGWTVNSITSWDWFEFKGRMDDVVQLASPLLKFHDTQEAESWQQELRLASAGGETVDWLLGAFWYGNEFERGDGGKRAFFLEDTYSAALVPSLLLGALFNAPVPVPFAVPGQTGLFAAEQDTRYLGVFGQTTWNLAEHFAVTGGVRWQTEGKDASIRQRVTVEGLSLMSAGLLVAGNSGELDRDTDEVTWSLTPQLLVNDDVTLFATIANGFKSGGFNLGWGTAPLDQREFADECIMHYEAGVKSTLLDRRVQVAASAFYTEYEDYQDAAFISQQFSVGNAEKAELKGFELEGNVLFDGGFTGDFSVSYADFAYDEYISGLCYPGRRPDDIVAGTCKLSGEQPINAPEWVTHLGLMYETHLSWGDMYARLDWSWSDEYNTSFSVDPRLVQEDYNWVNIRLGTRWGNYELVAWVENAGDEDVVNSDAQLNLFQNDRSYQTFLQAPRSYGLTLRAEF